MPAYARIETGHGGLPVIRARSADGAQVEVYTHGATVTSWHPAGGGERLFLSAAARFAPEAAIRGGVPLAFPQFDTLGSLPRHGFARTADWAFAGVTWDSPDMTLLFRLRAEPELHAAWPHAFSGEYAVTFGGQRLSLSLTIDNRDQEPFSFTGALHTYLRVPDIGTVQIHGLDGVQYIDKLAGGATGVQAGIVRPAGGIDRVYVGAPDTVIVTAGPEKTVVEKAGWPDVVVWNPGAGGASITDLEARGWDRFVCVEAAAVSQPVQVAAGGTWTGAQQLTAVEPG